MKRCIWVIYCSWIWGSGCLQAGTTVYSSGETTLHMSMAQPSLLSVQVFGWPVGTKLNSLLSVSKQPLCLSLWQFFFLFFFFTSHCEQNLALCCALVLWRDDDTENLLLPQGTCAGTRQATDLALPQVLRRKPNECALQHSRAKPLQGNVITERGQGPSPYLWGCC